jgi:hypothetical protein
MRATVALLLLAIVVRSTPGTRTQGTSGTRGTFVLQNNFWVNLHHVLRSESRRREVRARLKVKPDDLSSAERVTWSAALDAYRGHAEASLLFDATLVRISNALTRIPSEAPLPASLDGVDARTLRALAAAAPVYRAHYWAAQRELNDRWIAALRPALEAHGDAMIAAIEGAYAVRWPPDPIVVDACAEAPPTGGYTTDGPVGTAAHTVIEAANPEYQGDMAFEMLFHEASHAAAIGGPLIAAINASAARGGVAAPVDLWHVVIFYTAGELARRLLGKAGEARYLPYAYRYHVYSRGWQTLRDAAVRQWQPHLDGKTAFADAVDALVADATR